MSFMWRQLRAWKYHVALGLHSNIPPCCIIWFLTAWPLIYDKQWTSDWFRGYGYVRCPLCVLRRRVVKVRHCDCCWNCIAKEA